jgi:cell division protein FtsB
MRRVRSALLSRLLPLAVLVGALISVPVLVWSESGLPRLRKLQAEQIEARERSSKLSSEIRRLRAEVERVKRDPSHVERIARDELGLVRQTEVVFQFKR